MESLQGKFKVVRHIAVLSEGTRGWKRELNLVSWHGATPKYDIRDWSSNHDKMGKGITLDAKALTKLGMAIDTEIKKPPQKNTLQGEQ